MKTIRVMLLTMVLLAGATTRTVPTSDQANVAGTEAASEPECYLINGVWYCP